MSNKPHVYKDRDIKRIVKAVRASGEHVARVEVDPHTGKIAIITGKPEANGQEPSTVSNSAGSA
jgi:hypothetical protein